MNRSIAEHHFASLEELRDAAVRLACLLDHPGAVPTGPRTLRLIEHVSEDGEITYSIEIAAR